MTIADIIIIGAGAAGLSAARTLGRAGKKITVLEARSRIGGRIFTQNLAGFSGLIEAGAEFVHGDLPITRALLKEAGVECEPLAGKTYQVLNGKLQSADNFIPDFEVLLDKLNTLTTDIPFAQFLDQYLPLNQFAALREAVTRFAEGYDAADITKVSTFALREEWQTDGAANSQFPAGGYSQIMHFLAGQSLATNTGLHLSTVVKKINWAPGQVLITDSKGNKFAAKKAIITVPLGVWQAAPAAQGYISLKPNIPEHRQALRKMSFGAVIKIVLEFKTAFWETEIGPNQMIMPELGFLFTDAAPITAWWTHLPDKVPLLTGWLAGITAQEYSTHPDQQLIDIALTELAKVFNLPVEFLQKQLRAHRVFNWVTDPFARGAYAYATVGTQEARQLLAQPIQNTLFFAGEAFYEGPAMGTVEAALASGQLTAESIINSSA